MYYFLLLYLGIVPYSSVYFTGNIEKAAEVQIIIPLIGRNNSHTFVVQTYDKSEVNNYYSNVYSDHVEVLCLT